MIAETAFNVIEVLSPEEKKRLLKMLNADVQPIKVESTTPQIISDAQCREMIINQFKRFSKRFKEKQSLLNRAK
jgi:23S rRNA C2498 (ribose-2'-O)-methylase RlmM